MVGVGGETYGEGGRHYLTSDPIVVTHVKIVSSRCHPTGVPRTKQEGETTTGTYPNGDVLPEEKDDETSLTWS